MKNEKPAAPGDGLRSLKTSNLFRVVNFELYTKPNKAIMVLGLTAILGCSLYIMYMRKKYEGMGYYAAIAEDGTEYFERKKSKWED